MKIIFNNIYFYLFLGLLILYYILKQTLKKTSLSKESFISQYSFYVYLDKYLRNNNVLFTYFICFMYIFIAVLPFFILRVNRLGLSYIFTEINIIKMEFLCPVLFIMLSLIYFFKIVNFIFYDYVLKLHYYLHYKYKKYHYFVEDNAFLKDSLLFIYFSKIFSIFYHLNSNKKDFIKNYRLQKNILLEDQKKLQRLKKNWLFYLRLNYFAQKFLILKFLTLVFSILAFNLNRFVYYLPYSLVILSLAYDLICGKLYYTLFFLLYLYITNIIKKIRKFYYEKDPVYDNILSTYFYENDESYKQLKNALEKEDINKLVALKKSNSKIFECINNRENLIEYIKDDFKVYYVTDIIIANNEKYLMNYIKRFHILLLLLLFNFYIIYYNKYTLIVSHIEINLSIPSMLMLAIIYYAHKHITKPLSGDWVENKKPKILFRIMIFCYILIVFYLFVKNKLDPNLVEILINFKNIIIIKENFTIEEKYNYLKYYLENLMTDTIQDKTILNNILVNIKNKESITLNTTLDDIRNMAHDAYDEKDNSLQFTKIEENFVTKIKIIFRALWK